MTLLVLTVLAEVLALVLRFTARKAYAAWALGLGTLPALIQMTTDFAEGARRGVAMTRSDAEFLAAELAILALALLSVWRFGRWCFWLGWTLNLGLIGVFVYLAFFWHPFS